MLENRLPNWTVPPSRRIFERKKSLWGDVPAIDICRLQVNEEILATQDLRLLFAGKSLFQTSISSLAQPDYQLPET